MKLARGQKISFKIDRLSVGGRGVGRHDGIVVFVSDTAPEELIEAELTEVKKNFAEARLLRVIEQSPHRIQPICPVAGVCGGCSWQHVSYPEQLKQKRTIVIESLRRHSGFTVADELIAPTEPSPSEFRYRNRIQLHHASPGKLGFHKRGSHDVVDISDCPITEQAITQRFAALHKTYASKKTGRFEVFITDKGAVETRGLAPKPMGRAGSDDDDLLSSDPSGAAFAQVNTAQNIQLVNYVSEILRHELATAEKKPTALYDLYAGSGNFTFPAARALPGLKVNAIELSEDAVERGLYLAARDFTDGRIRFTASDVGGFLRRRKVGGGAWILLDPPRTGCGVEVANLLNDQGPALIVYISCHPVTLARDLKSFSERYEIVSVRPFDMFPQTDHVETVVMMRRIPTHLV